MCVCGRERERKESAAQIRVGEKTTVGYNDPSVQTVEPQRLLCLFQTKENNWNVKKSCYFTTLLS